MSASDYQEGPLSRSTPEITRRTFFRRLGAGLAVAVPSLYVLAHGSAASASTDCASAACTQTYTVYQGHSCGPRNSCPAGSTGHCIGVYYIYDTCTKQFCRSVTNDEGLCASR